MYTKDEALQYIQENDVKFIKLFFTDIFGVIKSLSIQPSELERAFETGISFDASAVKGFLNITKSDLFIVPDPATLCVLPWRPQTGRVVRFFCNVRYFDGTPFEGDPRLLLKNQVKKAVAQGYEIKIGTKCEFYLFKLDEKGEPTLIPHDHAGYCDLAPRDRGENVRREICLTLEQMGVHPEASHHETGPGQNEVDFRCSDPVNSADNLATFKTVVKTVADRYGLFASFMAKPLADQAGSGLHLSISLWKDGKNLFAGELSDEGRQFMAGIMSRMREITAFLNPYPNSYERFGEFEAPRYVSWSRENRGQLIRIPASEEQDASLELRSPDPSCNQYLAIYLVLAAGFEGITQKTVLPPAKDVDLYNASAAETKGLESLPLTQKEAVNLAIKSDFVKAMLSQRLIDAFEEAEESARKAEYTEI
ncbi:MAG: glutamine synthetase [Treponema sp.]|nr:glutamine synthetase [Treponema sp.]